MTKLFICQLSKTERFWYYKAIKRTLLANDCYTFENLAEAMNSKVKDLDGLLEV